MWGHIPYYFEGDFTAVALGCYRKPNDLALDSIVKLIIADLSKAETLLPDAPRNGEKGRVSRYTAMAYKGRVQVYAAGSNTASPYWPGRRPPSARGRRTGRAGWQAASN